MELEQEALPILLTDLHFQVSVHLYDEWQRIDSEAIEDRIIFCNGDLATYIIMEGLMN